MTYSEVQSTHVENQNKRNLNQSHQPLITQLTHALFSGKNSPNLLITILPLILFAWAPKKRRIYHNHSWKSTLNTTHCHNEKKLKLKQNNKKSRNISKKGILLHTTQSKMYCSILVSCLNKRLQSGGIEKKMKEKL